MPTTTLAPPLLMNTATPDPVHHSELQGLLDELVRGTGTSYGVVFGTHGLHLLRTGDLDQVGAESVTAIMTNVLLLSRGVGKLTERGEVETIVLRYRAGALVLAPLGSSFGLGLVTDSSEKSAQMAYAIAQFTTRSGHLLPQHPHPASEADARTGGVPMSALAPTPLLVRPSTAVVMHTMVEANTAVPVTYEIASHRCSVPFRNSITSPCWKRAPAAPTVHVPVPPARVRHRLLQP
ncbi:roadblock/LC7 domain-containing protein [Nocardiopsis terrae]